MDKTVQKNVKEVCEAQNVDSVYVVEDGNIFMESALNHAKNHAFGLKLKLSKVDANCDVLVENVLNPAPEIKTLTPTPVPSNSNPLREVLVGDMTMGQLRSKVKQLALQKGIDPITSTSKKPLIEFIEKAEKMEDRSTGEGSGEESGEGSDEGTGEGSGEGTGEGSGEESGEGSDEGTGEGSGEGADEGSGE